mmetsp:Transcript_18861/g.38408  ORF Transcript_18861/g.38408 Transcript_18861/m.38408 type:complete len:216 (+) Transcript_18861:23-670(+)
MDSQFLSNSTERSDARSYRSPRPSRSSIAGSSGGGCGCLQSNLVLHQPMQRLSLFISFLNKACGAALVLTGGWGVFDAVRTFDWPEVLGSVLLGIYVAGFGAMLLRYELAAARNAAFKRDYGFLFSHAGRSGFVLLCANLAWTCAPPFGFYTALLTNGNAVLNLYLLMCHPDYTTGRLSRLAIDGVVSGGQSHTVATEEGGSARSALNREDAVIA